MAPRVRDPIDRVISQTKKHGRHLIWTGSIHKNRPRFDRRVHPVRVLFGLDTPRIRFRTTCSTPNCIARDCQELYLAQDHKYGDLPDPDWRDPVTGLTLRDFTEIQHLIQQLREQQLTAAELREEYPSRLVREIERRVKLCPDSS